MKKRISTALARYVFVVMTVVLASSGEAGTGPQGLTLQGTILTASSMPEESASVAFTIQVKSPGAEGCLLFQETQTLNMSNSGGAFSMVLGSGVRSGSGFALTSTLAQVFGNAPAVINSLTCASGTTYTPATGDSRKVIVTFDDGSGPQTVSQVLNVESVPYAIYSDYLQDKLPSDFVQINTATAAVSQANLETIFASAANVTKLSALIGGTSTQYVSSGTSTFASDVVLNGAGTGLAVSSTTASTSSTTGAATIGGGLGVAGAIYTGGAINSGGAINATGAITGASTMSAATSLTTPIIYGSSAASGNLTLYSTSDSTKGTIMLAPTGGYVGVGKTGPVFPLEVSGIVQATGANSIQLDPATGAIYTPSGLWNYTTGANAKVLTQTTGTSITRNVADANPSLVVQQAHASSTGDILQLKNSASTVMTVQQAGKVGIGTTDPGGALDVTATAQPLGALAGIIAVTSSDNGAINKGGTISFGGKSDTTSTTYSFGAIGAMKENATVADSAGYLAFGTKPNGGAIAERMRITSTGMIGIGVNDPGAPVDINAPGRSLNSVAGLLAVTSTDNGAIDAGGTISLGGKADTSATLYSFGAIGALKENATVSDTAGYLAFGTKPNGGAIAERVRITSAGNLGIGTKAPLHALEVVDNGNDALVKFTGFSNTYPGDIRLYRARGTQAGPSALASGDIIGGLSFFAYGSSAIPAARSAAIEVITTEAITTAAKGSAILFKVAANGSTSTPESMRLHQNGFLGIGNQSPSKLLHVGSASVTTGTAVANFQNVDGTCTITPASSGSGIACSSDERLKENFQNVTGSFALDRLLRLQAVTYNFKTASPENRKTGYRAQQVRDVAPEFVRENDDGYLQVYYDAFIPWITESIKFLYDHVRASEARIQTLESENAALRARLDRLEKAIEQK